MVYQINNIDVLYNYNYIILIAGVCSQLKLSIQQAHIKQMKEKIVNHNYIGKKVCLRTFYINSVYRVIQNVNTYK